MGAPQMLQRFSPKMNKKNGFLILILVGLVVAAEFVEKDFICPCEEPLRTVFFTFYLLIPAIITLTITYCIMCELHKEDSESQKSDVENESQKSNEETARRTSRRTEETKIEEAEGPWNYRFFLKCCIPSVVWILLFFSDGRFLACLQTELKGGHADSIPHPPWEWCDKNRTLTTTQERAVMSYNYSKVAGFGCLLVLSLGILIYKCCKERCAANRQSGEQTGALAECIPLQ